MLKVFEQNFVLCLSFPCFLAQSLNEICEHAPGCKSSHSKSNASGTHYLYGQCSSELCSTCAGKLCMHSGHLYGNSGKKDGVPLYKTEENYRHVQERRTYGYQGYCGFLFCVCVCLFLFHFVFVCCCCCLFVCFV